VAVNDIYSLIVRGRVHGQATMNVFHYRVNVDGDADDADGLVGAFRTNAENYWLQCCSAEWELTGYICQKIHPLPVLSAFTQEIGFSPGLVEGNSLPSSVAVVMTKRTGMGGRRGRGRVYMPGVPASFEDNSEITDAALQTYDALGARLDTPLTSAIGGVYVPILWNRVLSEALTIIQYVPRTTLRNQRRRQVGRGI